MTLARTCGQLCTWVIASSPRCTRVARISTPLSSPQARHFATTPRRRTAAEPLPWFVDPETAPTGSSINAVEEGDDTSPRLATAPVPTAPPAHLSPALHPLHAYLSTSPFLDKDSLLYIHAREADPDASWCDWIVCTTLRHGRERGLRGAIEGVKRHLAANPVELSLDATSSPDGSVAAPPPFAPPSTRPEIHGLPAAPTKHARSRNLRTSRSSSSSRSPSASDAGTGWALLDAGTLVVHVFTPQARETYGRTIEQMWDRIGEVEHAQQHGVAATAAKEGWKSSARREEERKRAEELEKNMEEVKREMQLEQEEEARRRTA
ncbi:hypothetical protein JCM8115_003427 [Rhodotorula mucilaginosa]|uniref:Uncharacterized protein n=1 Tax=Rhodotorula mucilaginosa TaxID=5537 RepID=A0A9P6VTI6_RHOMI|nr:hypothetical protein C6P46_001635 [Rhodotorula mucilaginosa]TKA58301.1 hypothetical protein B0A53_00038 [Rhodotorula sp. CCFEE 5036]